MPLTFVLIVALVATGAMCVQNAGSALAYGEDDWTARLQEVTRQVFEHEAARVFPVVSGTAANSLALAAMCPPWGAVLCHETAHIVQNECGATSMYGGGAVMRALPGDDYRLHRSSLEHAFASVWCFLAAALFSIGLFGALTQQSVVMLMMGLELMLGGVIVGRRVQEPFWDGPAPGPMFVHGYTYSGHAAACAAALPIPG